MEPILITVVLVAVVAAASAWARKIRVSAPLLLTLVGIILSFIPAIPQVELTPDLVLFGFLPPLLYATAIRTSLVDFRDYRDPIIGLAVGLVVFTAAGVAAIAQLLLPISLAAAFALGAVVGPPDAVAATAIARRVGMPRRIVSLLEAESLLNDATALVLLRTALAAVVGGVTWYRVAGNFALAAGGGILLGVAAAALVALIRKKVNDTATDTTVSILTPFAVFIAGEELHVSGVVAVVVCGLILGYKAQRIQTPASRISEWTNWLTIQFVLENIVFLLIGLQVRSVVTKAAGSGLSTAEILIACGAILLSVILLRFIWSFASAFVRRRNARARFTPTYQNATVVGWAGMRGVVTLATAFLLPEDLPYRNVLILIAFVVTAGTLLLQGSTLGWLVRRLGIRGPDRREDLLAEAQALREANLVALTRLEEMVRPDDPPEVTERLRTQLSQRLDRTWERLGPSEGELETPSAAFARLRRGMIEVERLRILELRNAGTYPHEVLTSLLFRLDVEQTMIDSWIRSENELRTEETVMEERRQSVCEHLDEAPLTAVPLTPEGCQECLADGSRWVHLRLCLACGHVGCCDSSPNRHASAHFHRSTHPVARSFEPGENWRWCFVDEKVG